MLRAPDAAVAGRVQLRSGGPGGGLLPSLSVGGRSPDAAGPAGGRSTRHAALG